MIRFFFLLFLIGFFPVGSEEFPVLYQGRYRPAETYARLWLFENYHAQQLKSGDLEAFHTSSRSALALLWALEFQGGESYQTSPLFWIGSAKEKQRLGLPLQKDRFSYEELKGLLPAQHEFERLVPQEDHFETRLIQLRRQGISPKEIGKVLEQEFPLMQRLRNAGPLFKALPARFQPGEWLPLKALKTQVYRSSVDALELVGNFTLFRDEDFEKVRQAYLREDVRELTHALQKAYQPLAGSVFQEAHGKHLSYPTTTQLKMESVMMKFPWIPLLIALYGIALFLILSPYKKLAIAAFGIALFCHTLLLGIRCYILARPPVSNMFETVIYVPWVAGCASLFIPALRRQPLAVAGAAVASIILLVIVEVASLNQSLEQVQAVLDSQFWLTIHVLLVVGSYGIFILAALLGHFYLALFLTYCKETANMVQLSRLLLQLMYGGTAMLITGTILGGVWAAESWGRFWDWDPKESWAFISSALYLIWIHAYRFHRIGSFGLAIGSVVGLLTISFTWYGVNYILGTGLHSYGFGSGGEFYYYLFLALEAGFIGASLVTYYSKSAKIKNL